MRRKGVDNLAGYERQDAKGTYELEEYAAMDARRPELSSSNETI